MVRGGHLCSRLWARNGLCSGPTAPAQEAVKTLPMVDLDEKPAFPLPKHLESKDIAAGTISYPQLFDDGGKLFHTPYNGLDGVGLKRTIGGMPLNRFSAGPAGGGQPGPTAAQSCGACHSLPTGAGFGLVHTRVLFSGTPAGTPPIVARKTTSLYGDGVVQLLAEEMTDQLLAARDAAAAEAKAKPGSSVSRELKGQRRGLWNDRRDGERKGRRHLRHVKGSWCPPGSRRAPVRLEGTGDNDPQFRDRGGHVRPGDAG